MEKQATVGPNLSNSSLSRGFLKQIALVVVAFGTLLVAEKLFWAPFKRNEGLPRFDPSTYEDKDFDWDTVSLQAILLCESIHEPPDSSRTQTSLGEVLQVISVRPTRGTPRLRGTTW